MSTHVSAVFSSSFFSSSKRIKISGSRYYQTIWTVEIFIDQLMILWTLARQIILFINHEFSQGSLRLLKYNGFLPFFASGISVCNVRAISDRKLRRMEVGLSPCTASNLWLLSVAVRFMGIRCLNWKIIGQCLGTDRSACGSLFSAYNLTLADFSNSISIYLFLDRPSCRNISNSRSGANVYYYRIVNNLDAVRVWSVFSYRKNFGCWFHCNSYVFCKFYCNLWYCNHVICE